MMNEKKVNINTTFPLFIRNSILRGNAYNVTMSLSAIHSCLLANATVDEILNDGSLLRLNLFNYNKDNNVVETPVEEPVKVEEKVEVVVEPVKVEELVEIEEKVEVVAEPVKIEEPAQPVVEMTDAEIEEELKKLEAEEAANKEVSAEDQLLAAIEAEEKEMSNKKKKKH